MQGMRSELTVLGVVLITYPEPHMVCVNSFVEDNLEVMNEFLLRVASDPNKKPGTIQPPLSFGE